MQTSADSSSPACPLSAAGVAVEGVRGNTPAAPTGAHTSDTTRTAERAVDERTPPRIAAPASSVEALAKVLAMCLVRICRLEERQARGEAQQSIFGTALQALLIQAHGQQQQQQSCGQAAIEAHGEDGDANSSDAHDRERSEQYPCSRHTTSCRTSSWSHVNRPPTLGDSSNGSRHHSEDGYDRAAVPSTAAAASELHSQQRCRRHRSVRHTQGSEMHRPHGADAPASSSLESTATADISAAAAATAAGAAVTGSEGDDAHANHSTGSQHHRHQSPGAGAATGAVPSPSPADLANTKWKEASSGAGAGVGGGCTHAIPSTTAPGNYRNTPTASAAVASGSINELPMISHFGSPSGGGGRQRQGSLVTVVSPTHTSQAEEAEAHAIAAAERISAGVSSAPAGAMPVNCFTWAVPVTPLSSSENSRCSTPVELHMSARSLSQQQQQQPTQPSTEEWSSCICGHRAEGTDEVTYNGPDAAPSVHPQQQRGSRGHLRSSPTHVAPLADHPQRPPARLHQQPAYRKGEDRELSSSSRLAATALRSAGSTATSSAAHTGDELDVLFHALSAPHPAASVPASSNSAAASGAQATGTLTRRVQYPAGTDNTTAINELFAQVVQNTMEMTRMKENLAVLVLSVHKEREKRRRLQRREGSAVQRLVQRVLDMSSVMLRLQRTVRRLELEASSGHASDAAGWHHHHNSHRRRRGADSSRSAGVSDQDEDTATCDGDVDDGESEWRERFCASFSTASVAVSRSRRSGSVTGSGHRQSVGDRSGNVGYAALAAPFSSSWSLSAGCERVVPAVRSPWLSSLTTQCSTDVARGEAILGRGGAVPTGTVTSTPVVDDVDNTSTSPAPPGTVSPQRLAGATPVTAAPAAASAGPLLVAGSVALPKIISSSSSLHSLVTASAVITTNVNTTAAATTTTTATTSRAASATLVPQSMVSSSVSAPRRERLPSLLLSPPAMLDVCATESRSSAVTSNSSVVPALSITDVHFGLALACRESATEDKLPALAPDAAAVGRGSGGPRAEGASNSATHDGDAHRGGCSGQRSEVDGARHDGEKEQRHLTQPPQQKQRRQDVSGGSSTSSRCRQREHSMRRAAPAAIVTTAVLMPIPGGTQHSFASAQHPPAPPPRQTTSSRKSPASAFAGTSSAAARENSSVPARRLLDALSSEHRSGAVTGASTVVNVAAETGGKGHSVSSGTGAVNTTTTASTDSPAVSLTSSVAALKFTGSTANLACRTLNGATATALAQLASAPVTARPRRRQQRSGSSIAKPSPKRREARRPWSGLIQSVSPATPRSKAAAADRRGDMRDDACGTDVTSSAALQGGEALPTWRNAAISASPTQSSSDRSRSSHPQHSLLSSWLQSPPARMATAAGGDDKTILSPVTPTSATTITAGGEKLCRPSAGAYRSHSNSGSIPSTPSRRLNAQLAPSPASTPAVGAGGASVSSPSSKLQLAQPVIPIAVGHHPQQLLQTTATSHQARKWTSIPLLSSATVSGTLPHVPMMASVQSASSFLRITSILLSPSMAHPASPVSPLATGSPACAGTGTGSSGATAGSLPARIAQPVSPLSSTSRLDQYHRPHSSRALYLSANCSSNTNASLAAPRTPPPTPPHGHPPNLAHQQPGDAAVQPQHAVVLSRSAAALIQTTNALPRVVASPASSSRSSRVTPLIALRRTKPLAPAAAALASLQPAQSGYEAKTLARVAVAPTGKTQRPANSAKVSGKAKQAPSSSPLAGRDSAAVARGVATHEQALCSSSLVAHHPCSSPLKLTGDPGHRPQPLLQTPSSAQERRSGRRTRAGLPPPLSVETLSDASVSALRTSSVGTTGSMDVEKGITKGDVGDGVSGPAMHDHGGGICPTLVTLSAVAGAGQHRGYSTQLHPPELIAEEAQEKTGRERSTPAAAAVPSLPGTPTALVIAGVRGAMRSANRGSNASDAGVDRAISLEDGEDVYDDDDSSVQQALRTPLQQQQRRRPLGGVNAAEQPPMHFSFLFDASTPVSMLSDALQRNRSSLNQQQQQHHKRTAASVGPASSMPNTASHDSCASSSHTSTSAISSPSGTRSSGGGEASTRPPPPSSSRGTTPSVGANVTDSTQGSLSPVELEAIEQRFVEVLRALSAEPQLEPFRNEYEKLHRLLLSSHDGEQRLLRQARELRDELDTHHQQITTAMVLSQEDEEAIRALRREIEAAWAKADTAHEQEHRSRELLHTLRQQVTELDAMVEKTAGLSMGQEAYLRDLLTVKKDREEEAMLLHAALNRTEADHRQVSAQLAAAKQAHEAAQRERDEKRHAYQHLLTSLEEEQRERAAKEASVWQYRDTTELCMRRLDERGVEVERAIREEKKAAKEAEGTAQEIQAIARQLQERQERFAAEAARLAAAERENTVLTRELPQRQAALREQQDELKREEKQLHLLEKSARAQQAELAALVEKRATAAAAVQTRANSVDAALNELATEEKERAVLEEVVAKAMQCKTNMMHTNTVKATASSKVEGQRVMETGKSRRLNQQLELLRTDNERMRKSIYYAEQNHEKNTKEAQQALLSYHRTLDSIRTRRSEAKAVEEDIALHQKKLKAQQALLSTVTADRQKTEKALRETEAELLLLRNRHGSKQEELESVKTELIQQESDMCQLHGLSRQLNKDVANTEQRLRFLREDQQHAESRVEALRSEAQQLRQVIAQYDLDARQQGARLRYMTHERNAIATQLLLRSEELELIREKIRLANVARVSGTTKYQRAMKQLLESRDLLLEQRLRCRIALVRLRYLDRLHTKEMHQEKLLSQSRARVRALADELGTKHNVHCWRSMESNAPEVLDALAKVQLLQAKLLRKHGELKAKTDLVENEERAYQQLRQKLARMPGPEAVEELALCAENMQQHKARLLGMTDSLAEAEQEAEALEGHVAQLQDELQDLKLRYYQEKTKYAALRREDKLIARTWGAGGAGVGAARQAGSGAGSSVGDGGGAVVAAGASAPSAEQRRSNTNDKSPSAGGPASADVAHRSASQPQRPHLHAGGSGVASTSHNDSVTPRNGRRRAPLAEAMLDTLTAGPPQPNFPLQRPPHQRQFVGGGFSLTR